MHEITSGVFAHLDITYPMDVDQRVAYMQRILREAAIKKYKAVLLECKQSENDLAGDGWTLGNLKELSTDEFLTWAKSNGIGYDGDAYLGLEKCVDFEKELWFELGKAMCRKHQIVYQGHLKYIHSDIVKPFHVGILRYTERVQDMHDLAKQLPPLSIKGDGYESDNWKVHDE